MKTIIDLAAKDLKLLERDWLSLFFIVAFPIGMGVFFGMVTTESSESAPSMGVVVVDEDRSDRSQRLVQLLEQDDSLRVLMADREQGFTAVRRGQEAGVLVIPPGFGETAGVLWSTEPTRLQLGADPGRQAEAGMIEGMVMKAMGQITMERFQDSESMRPMIGDSMAQIESAEGLSLVQRTLLKASMTSLDQFLKDLTLAQQELEEENNSDATDGSAAGAPVFNFATIEALDVTEPKQPSAQQTLLSKVDSGWDISFPSAMLWGVLACVAGFAISIVRERTRGTWVRLQIAPIRRSQILFGKALACFLAVLAVIVMMTLIGIGLGMRPDNLLFLTLAALAIAYCYVGIMMTMSVLGKTEEVVSGASWGANVVFAMFGGAMIPLAFLPSFMRPLSHLSPVKWAILSLEGAIWRQFSWGEMLLPLGVLMGIGTLGMIIGCAILRRD